MRRQAARALGVLRPDCIEAWPDFVAALTPEDATASPADFDRAIACALRETGIARFEQAGEYPGFRRSAARLIEELIECGVTPAMLGSVRELPPDVADFRTLYAATEQRLKQWRVLPLAAQLRVAATDMPASRLPRQMVLEGFEHASASEKLLLRSIANAAALEYAPRPATRPYALKIRAASPQAECMDIARRIAELCAGGRHPGDFAIVTGSADEYAPLIQTALGRFNISAGLSVDLPLAGEPLIAQAVALIEALISGWDRRLLLDLVRQPAAGLIGTASGDELEFLLRRTVPGTGLPEAGILNALHGFNRWLIEERAPREWAERLSALPLTPPGPSASVRANAEALAAWKNLLTAAARAMPMERVPLAPYWAEVRDALPAATARPEQADAVQVISAMDAYSCFAPIVFVCGLVEGVFPAYPPASPFLSDAARRELIAKGLPLEPPEARAAQERRLAMRALASAEHQLYLSWPSYKSDGEERLPAVLIEQAAGAEEQAIACRPRPARSVMIPPQPSFIPIEFPAAKKWSPSEIERFEGCPFRYFGERTMKLEQRPDWPEERFGPLERGNLAHGVLRTLAEAPALGLDDIFDEHFRELCRALHIPPSHRIEWERLELLRNLSAYLATARKHPGLTPHAEWAFEYELVEGVTIRGRIDRFDEGADGAVYAMDYKYSAPARVKQQAAKSVQGGLYMLALARAGYRPKGFAFVPLRGGDIVELIGPPEMAMENAREKALDIIARIRNGEIAVEPLDRNDCKWCDFQDACRIQARGAAEEAEESE